MRLSLCMIVRDNEAIIEECLTSIRPFVDEMIVVDTGSQDATADLAERLGAKVSSFGWIDDFSAARNASIAQASGEWIFWMDSDDVIDEACGQKLRELADGQHPDNVLGYVMQVHCPGEAGAEGGDVTVVDHVKMFRNRPDLRFEGRIHEQILASIRRADGEVAWTDIFVIHKHGSVTPEARRRKHQRDLRILHEDLKERPDHPFVLFNLGMTYADMQQPDQAIEYLKESIAVADANESHLPKAHTLLAACLLQTEQVEAACELCETACEQFPDDIELKFRWALALHQSGRYPKSIELYQQILHTKRKERKVFESRDAGIAGHKARHNLAVIYSELNRWSEAELQWRLAIDEAPYFQSALFGLAESLIAQQKWNTIEETLGNWRNHEPRRLAAAWLEGLASARQGRIAHAIDTLREAQTRFPDNTDLLDAECKVLFETGRIGETEPALLKLADLRPRDGSVRHNLGQLYLQLGRRDEAIAQLKKSIELRPDSPATIRLLADLEAIVSQS